MNDPKPAKDQATENEIKQHYESVTEAWRHMMGQQSHYGFFKTGDEDLDLAAEQMIDAMLALIDLSRFNNSQILDIGCGWGETASYLQQKLNSRVTGISLSSKEVQLANTLAKNRNQEDYLLFKEMDFLDNDFTDNSFDIVIIVETSLLIPDKEKLFSEIHRILKNDGCLLLCDQLRLQTLSPAQMYKNGEKLEALNRTFGNTKTETLDFYQQILEQFHFNNIHCQDISQYSQLSPERWKQNCLNKKDEILTTVSEERYENFLKACDALKDFLKEGVLGYGIVVASK